MTSTVIGKFDYEGDEARIEGDSVPLFQSTTTPDSVSYEEAEDIVYEQAKKTLNKAMEDFGGA